MSTFIVRLDEGGVGPTLAVKDLIDLEGLPTSAGSRAMADLAKPAVADAVCMAGARAAGARIVGKANLHELAFGTTGINQWFGTPVNPLDPGLVPGGSSSGSAVAVAAGDAEVAYGSDTGGSIRVPAAFCGVSGLKTSFGRINLTGVQALSPSLDSVGPMAAKVAGVIDGMALLEPGFNVAPENSFALGRVRVPDLEADPAIEAALDLLLASSEQEVVEIVLDDWGDAYKAAMDILLSEAADTYRFLIDDQTAPVSEMVRGRLEQGAAVTDEAVAAGWVIEKRWKQRLELLFDQVSLLVLPTVAFFPPALDGAHKHVFNRFTVPINLAGLPAFSLPVPSSGPLPASVQLVGPPGGDERCCAGALFLEGVAGSLDH